MIVGIRGPVEPSVHPIMNSAEQKERNCQEARRDCFLDGLYSLCRMRESNSFGGRWPLSVGSRSEMLSLTLTISVGYRKVRMEVLEAVKCIL